MMMTTMHLWAFYFLCLNSNLSHPHFPPHSPPRLNLKSLLHHHRHHLSLGFWIGGKQVIVSSSPFIHISLQFQLLTDFQRFVFVQSDPSGRIDRFTDHDDDATREWVAMLLSFEGFRNEWMNECIMDQAKVSSCSVFVKFCWSKSVFSL
jgi:hypothetical protein